MDASDQPTSGVATRPFYSLQVNIGGTGKVRDIRLEGGYSAKQLVDLLGQLSLFCHREGARRSAATMGSMTAAATASSSESSIGTRTREQPLPSSFAKQLF